MGFTDIVLTVVIISGAAYLLYRSLWKNKGHCQGCTSGMCDAPKKYESKKCQFLPELH